MNINKFKSINKLTECVIKQYDKDVTIFTTLFWKVKKLNLGQFHWHVVLLHFLYSSINSISSGCFEYFVLFSSKSLVNSSMNILWYLAISSVFGLAIFGTSIGLPTVNNNNIVCWLVITILYYNHTLIGPKVY